jgi:hypothetical protein
MGAAKTKHRPAGCARNVSLRVLLVAVLGLLQGALATAACRLDSVELPVTMSGPQPVVRAGVNASEELFVVDSGAVYSMMAAAAAERLRLPSRAVPRGLEIYGVGGRADVEVARVERFRLL